MKMFMILGPTEKTNGTVQKLRSLGIAHNHMVIKDDIKPCEVAVFINKNNNNVGRIIISGKTMGISESIVQKIRKLCPPPHPTVYFLREGNDLKSKFLKIIDCPGAIFEKK